MINVLLADDHVIIRAGLKIFIGHHVPHSVIDEASDGDSAFEKIKEKDYHLIILDVNMPGTDSFGLVSNIIVIKPKANILMFSMNAEEVYAKKYLQMGVKGYLSKTSDEAEMKNALDNVINGKRYISPFLTDYLTQDAVGERSKNPFDDLSPKEFQITQHLIRGESLSEICLAFNLHSSTIGTHKARIFTKLKCKNIIEVNQLARIYNIIPRN